MDITAGSFLSSTIYMNMEYPSTIRVQFIGHLLSIVSLFVAILVYPKDNGTLNSITHQSTSKSINIIITLVAILFISSYIEYVLTTEYPLTSHKAIILISHYVCELILYAILSIISCTVMYKCSTILFGVSFTVSLLIVSTKIISFYVTAISVWYLCIDIVQIILIFGTMIPSLVSYRTRIASMLTAAILVVWYSSWLCTCFGHTIQPLLCIFPMVLSVLLHHIEQYTHFAEFYLSTLLDLLYTMSVFHISIYWYEQRDTLYMLLEIGIWMICKINCIVFIYQNKRRQLAHNTCLFYGEFIYIPLCIDRIVYGFKYSTQRHCFDYAYNGIKILNLVFGIFPTMTLYIHYIITNHALHNPLITQCLMISALNIIHIICTVFDQQRNLRNIQVVTSDHITVDHIKNPSSTQTMDNACKITPDQPSQVKIAPVMETEETPSTDAPFAAGIMAPNTMESMQPVQRNLPTMSQQLSLRQYISYTAESAGRSPTSFEQGHPPPLWSMDNTTTSVLELGRSPSTLPVKPPLTFELTHKQQHVVKEEDSGSDVDVGYMFKITEEQPEPESWNENQNGEQPHVMDGTLACIRRKVFNIVLLCFIVSDWQCRCIVLLFVSFLIESTNIWNKMIAFVFIFVLFVHGIVWQLYIMKRSEKRGLDRNNETDTNKMKTFDVLLSVLLSVFSCLFNLMHCLNIDGFSHSYHIDFSKWIFGHIVRVIVSLILVIAVITASHTTYSNACIYLIYIYFINLFINIVSLIQIKLYVVKSIKIKLLWNDIWIAR
eukprot:1000647_1